MFYPLSVDMKFCRVTAGYKLLKQVAVPKVCEALHQVNEPLDVELDYWKALERYQLPWVNMTDGKENNCVYEILD